MQEWWIEYYEDFLTEELDEEMMGLEKRKRCEDGI